MTPAGPSHERETIIRFSDEDDTVEIWTASAKIYRKLQRLGFECVDDGERHADFRCSMRNITIRKAKSAMSEARKALAIQALSELRKKVLAAKEF